MGAEGQCMYTPSDQPLRPMLYLLLGSNLGNREAFLRDARAGIARRIGSIRQVSDIFETAAWGTGAAEQPPYLNQAIAVVPNAALLGGTDAPEVILQAIHEIEAKAGRERAGIWQSRTLDIDILLYGNRVMDTPTLRIPHPHLPHRRFALTPLAQIAPQFYHPLYRDNVRLRTISDLLRVCPDPLPVRIHTEATGTNLQTPAYIAIEGVIGAGKTTLANKIAQTWNTQPVLEEFSENPFLPRFYAEPEAYALPVELHFLTDRHAQLRTAARIPLALQVADYCFHKCLLFAQVTLGAEAFALYERVYQMAAAGLPKPSEIIYLHASVPHLQRAIRGRGRVYEQSIPDSYLERLAEAYEAWLPNAGCPVLWVDVERVNYLGDDYVYDQLIRARPRDGVTRFWPR